MTRRQPVKRAERRSTFRKIQEDFGEESPSENAEDEEDFQSVSTDNQATDDNLELSRSLKRPRSKNPSKQATPRKSSQKKSSLQAGPSQPVTRKSPRQTSFREEQTTSSRKSNSRVHFSDHSDQSVSPERDVETPTRNYRTVSAGPSESRQRPVGESRKTNQADVSKGRGRRKQVHPKKKNRILQEIRRLQQATGNLIPKLPFSRVIREILMQETEHGMRITVVALEALHEAAELYLVQLFEDAYRCTVHRDRVTLSVKDIDLVRYLRGPADPGNIH